MSEFPRGTIAKFREHLNKTVPTAGESHWQPAHGKAGAKTRLYGDWLYSADREMFMWELREQIKQGTFK